MSVLVVGLNHRTAPTAVLEAAAVVDSDVPKALSEVVAGAHVAEAALLSTCNRVEVYANVTAFHGGVAEVTDLLSRVSGLSLEDLSRHLYVHHDSRAVQHLFSVACGLDSMLVGEPQILGQLRAAFRQAQGAGTVGRVLGELMSSAMRVGKRAHSETGIDRVGASLVAVGLGLAEDALGSLEGRSALVIGAGSTGALAGATLRRAGVGDLVVANRTQANADRLAQALEGRAVGLEAIPAEILAADLVVASTGATTVLVSAETVADAMAARGGRPLVVLDLALPRDVSPAAADIEGVTLVDLESLKAFLEQEPAGEAVETVREIVLAEVNDFVGWQRAKGVAPTVVALREKADQTVRDELDRLLHRLPELDETARTEIASTVNRVVDKLLHGPTVRVKELAAEPGGDAYAVALRELFDLDRHAPEVVSVPTVGEAP